MQSNKIKEKFNKLREKYGNLLIKLKKEKISEKEWHRHIFKEFDEKEILFIFGQNIRKFTDKKNTTIDLDKGTRVEVKNNSSRLIISPAKAGILTWICTDGYMSLRRGYYISIRDDNTLIFNHFKKLIKQVYGNVNFQITKIKNKNAFQCLFCSKDIFRDLITYIPLSSSKNWTIPTEILDKEAKKEVLKILTHTEGSTFKVVRRRAIEITLANLEVLIQTQSLFEEFEINTNPIRKDFSEGWKRYKFAISARENLEKFRKEIHFIPNTKKYEKFENIMDGYKEYHHPNNFCSPVLVDTIKENKLYMTKEIIKISGVPTTSALRNLKKLRQIGAIDYKKGKGNAKHWFAVYG